jgi:hypothetical protein
VEVFVPGVAHPSQHFPRHIVSSTQINAEEYMTENINPNTRATPQFESGVTEVVAVFPNKAALEDATNRLTLAGFDRADLSLPTAEPPAGQATPETSATPVYTDTDRRQARTLGTSLAAAAAAMGAAGVTVATGGAALAGVAAAALGGGAAAAAAHAIDQGADAAAQANRETPGEAGELRLSVRVTADERRQAAESAMRAAGGQQIIVRQR